MTILKANYNYLLLIAPFIGALIVLYATRFGIGVSPDSTFYISAADYFYNHGEVRSIFEGSKWAYMTHYPPGYSIMLSAIKFFTGDIYEAARWCNAFFMFALLFLIGLIVKPYISLLSAFFCQIIILGNVSFFSIYQMAWSEPPYLFFSVLGLYLLYLYVNNSKTKFLIASSLIISIAISVRYVGISLIAAGAIYLFISQQAKTKKKLASILIYGVLSSWSILFWTIRNSILVDNPTDRHFSYHPMPIEYYQSWFKTTSEFFMPFTLNDSIFYFLGGALFLAIITFSIIVVKKHTKTIVSVFSIYSITYLLLLFTSNTFFDDTPIYFRTLSPIYFLLLIGLIVFLLNKHNAFLRIKTVFFIIWTVFFIKEFNFHVRKIDDGLDYSSRHFKIPETIEAINELPVELKIFTNEVDRYYYLSNGRASDWLNDLNIKNEQNYAVVLFKNGRNYNTEFWKNSGIEWIPVIETEDVSIKRKKEEPITSL